MGLFDFLKVEDKEDKKEFKSKIVVCEKVNDELIKISKEFNIPLSMLDFDILNYKTFVNLDGNFEEADSEILSQLNDKNFLLNPELKIKQVYEIKIKKYVPNDNFEILGKMFINKYLTSAQFLLSKRSVLKDFDETKFYNELNKKKLRNSLLIGIFESQMKEDIQKLSSIIKDGKIEEDNFPITLCKGIDPIPGQDGKVIYHYKRNAENIKKQLIYPVKEKEVIIEIIKHKTGKAGRNCRGEVIENSNKKLSKIPEIIIDVDAIKKVEDDDKILFIAKRNGFLAREERMLTIKDNLEVSQINIRTGDVKEANKTHVKIEVKEKHILKEAIGDNMIVESDELIVRGNVGNRAIIKSDLLEIEGQTHKYSEIEAKKAQINRHKGKLVAKEAQINYLEGGEVRATKVTIKNALSGIVIAEEIEIENLKSHVKMYALKEIRVKNLLGDENLFAISPQKVLAHKNIDELENNFKEIEKEIENIKRELNKINEVIVKNKEAYLQLKEMYIENKSKKIPTPPTILKKIKEYQYFYKKLKELKEELKKKENKREEIKEKLEYFQNSIYNAKIISFSPWKAFNRIEFDLIEPPVSIKYDTKGNEGVGGFKLRFFGDTVKIVKIKVKEDDISTKG